MPNRLRAYLQLLRVPNLFTVPGDPLCGFLLVSGGIWSWRAIPPLLISLCAYCFGLILNDLSDLPEDRRERPKRPLPGGTISTRAARWLLALFFLLIVIAEMLTAQAARDCAFFLVAAIILYNTAFKKSPVFGPIVMGLCRALSVLVGALAILPVRSLFIMGFGAPDPRVALRALSQGLNAGAGALRLYPLPFVAACVIGFYIIGVTALARAETKNPRIPPLIGALIRGLLFIQAGFCAAAGGAAGWTAAALLLALWPISRLVGSHFYAS